MGFEHQITELIQMGLERFQLDIGILSRISGSDYTVQYCVTPEDVPLAAGDKFDFGATYCDITCHSDGPVAIEHVGKHEKYAVHPAYKAFGLESYIGIAIHVNGELYGTLNFSSPNPYEREFRDIDVDALTLMATWIEGELVRREQEAQLIELNHELKLLANSDSLTKVLNRRGMYKELHNGLNYLSRTKGKATIAIIDIDFFKNINDNFGHQKGDEVLLAVAETISNSIRGYDFVARFGGEEFLIWLPDDDEDGCRVVCDRIMEGIKSISLVSIPLTISIGACCFEFNCSRPKGLSFLVDSLIGCADKALYQAKDEGRNRLVVNYFDTALV